MQRGVAAAGAAGDGIPPGLVKQHGASGLAAFVHEHLALQLPPGLGDVLLGQQVAPAGGRVPEALPQRLLVLQHVKADAAVADAGLDHDGPAQPGGQHRLHAAGVRRGPRVRHVRRLAKGHGLSLVHGPVEQLRAVLRRAGQPGNGLVVVRQQPGGEVRGGDHHVVVPRLQHPQHHLGGGPGVVPVPGLQQPGVRPARGVAHVQPAGVQRGHVAAQFFKRRHERHVLAGEALQQQHPHAPQVGAAATEGRAVPASYPAVHDAGLKAGRGQYLVHVQPQPVRAQLRGQQAQPGHPLRHAQHPVRLAEAPLLRHQLRGIEGRVVAEVHDAPEGGVPVRPAAHRVGHPVHAQKGVVPAPAHQVGDIGVFQIVAPAHVPQVLGGIHRREAGDEVRGVAHQRRQPVLRLPLRAGVAAQRRGGRPLGDRAIGYAVHVHGAGKEHRHRPPRGAFKHVLAGQHVQQEIAVPAQVRLAGHVGQRGQVDRPVRRMGPEQGLHVVRAGQVAVHMGVVPVVELRPGDVHADHPVAALAQRQGHPAADHARGPGEQYGARHVRPRSLLSCSRVMNRAPRFFSQRMTLRSFFRLRFLPTRQRKRVTRPSPFGSGSGMAVSSKGWA